ncbi:hypothetical protein WICPIJ_004729 [Wickerhamomyces pijperi]|uniref:Uncharacterized protein n=1 Tax=Wickerhamomyces pijperi TaxID=599730 RepID=A0A9P8TML4_WICPI|nr:hypothetical protein WICPIJ_004729 [Wickerhamomyces pijperi]
MGLFRKSSSASQTSDGSGGPKVKLTKDDVKNYKIRTGNVHDPILQAMNEAQPFEEAETSADATQFDAQHQGQRQSYAAMASNGGLNDVFGRPINRPDISNPTRSRDERPLDTIRAFEYAITGDNTFREHLESEQLGFRPRQDFPRFGNGNPYAAANNSSSNAPVHSFTGGNQEEFEQGVYQAAPKVEEEKKKKRGLFGRKK